MFHWERIKIGLIMAGVVLGAEAGNAAFREHDVPVSLMSAVIGAVCFGGAALVHRYRC